MGALYTGSDGDQGALGGSLVHWENEDRILCYLKWEKLVLSFV